MRYIYFGKCEDGKYWFIWKNLLRYVVYSSKLRKVITRTWASLREVAENKTLLRELPRKVRTWIKQHLQELIRDVSVKVRKVDLEKIHVAVTFLRDTISTIPDSYLVTIKKKVRRIIEKMSEDLRNRLRMLLEEAGSLHPGEVLMYLESLLQKYL